MKNKFAFTLAEVMIVLAVIGVLSAVLIPAALNSGPNEDIAKFKNGHNAFLSAIRELVTSDKYYLDGDLGVKSNGELLWRHATNPEENAYFCQTFGDVISAKYVDCVNSNAQGGQLIFQDPLNDLPDWNSVYVKNGLPIPIEDKETSKKTLDKTCKIQTFKKNISAKQFITPNGIWYYNPAPGTSFGALIAGNSVGRAASERLRIFSSPHEKPTFYDDAGMDTAYKVLCMDIDGVPDNATKDDCVNECPFGFGIRADGKIFNGAKADEWLEKSISQKD